MNTPKTPEDIADFIGPHFSKFCKGEQPEDDTYTLTAHDLISAFAAWGENIGFDDALRIARGCLDYGGGYRGNVEHYEIYQHGIQTVIAALAASIKTGLEDTQTAALHAMGATTIGLGATREPLLAELRAGGVELPEPLYTKKHRCHAEAFSKDQLLDYGDRRAAAAVPVPFTDAQLRRLWNNSPEMAKNVTSCEGFKRVVRHVEAAHRIVTQQPPKEAL